MRVLILGGDGYLGWPTAMRFARKGHEVMVVDNFTKRRLELELGITPLIPITTLHRRVETFNAISGRSIALRVGDLLNHRFVYNLFDEFEPDTVIHYGEQPSAPYSMHSRSTAFFTQYNNVLGTLNVLFAMQHTKKDCHLIKLGTMGEYGTPNIDIEEGYIEIEYRGRRDLLPYPKQPGSFYHLTKVHDSHNIMFATKVWGLRATDLNQGVVYGIDTEETKLHPNLATSFHYDEIFGTVLNRFCTQAVLGTPLTVYGRGGQRRGFLNIIDTLKCVEIAALNPPKPGRMRVFNQFTEVFSVNELAGIVKRCAEQLGMRVETSHVENPRIELEEHYYNPTCSSLLELGLEPTFLAEELINSMLKKTEEYKDRINPEIIQMGVLWRARSSSEFTSSLGLSHHVEGDGGPLT
jgi:UDP-sulfoquinovose synthase